jgi:hypothetical protein
MSEALKQMTGGRLAPTTTATPSQQAMSGNGRSGAAADPVTL